MGRLGRKQSASPDELSPQEREVVERLVAIGDRVLMAWTSMLKVYVEVAPDGRRLEEPATGQLREALVETARCGRLLDRERELVDQVVGEVDLRSSRDLLRSLRHSMLLALADDPDLRARAMSADELKARARQAYEDWGHIMGRS